MRMIGDFRKGNLKRLETAGRLKAIRHIIVFLMAGCLLLCSNASALETSVKLEGGYDDNVAKIPAGEGSGLAKVSTQFEQVVFKGPTGSRLDLFLDAMYCDYTKVSDNYRVQAGTEFYSGLWHDRFRTGVFVQAEAYRDEYVAEDEYNMLLAGGELQWLANARVTLSLRESFSRVDYRNGVSLPGQRAFTIGMGKGPGSPMNSPTNGNGSMNGSTNSPTNTTVETDLVTLLPRNDTLWTSEMAVNWIISPDLQADLSAIFRNANSSDSYETFREEGGSGKLSWFCSQSMEIFANGYWSTLDYDISPEGGDRRDDVYGFGLGGSRTVGNIKFQIQFDRSVIESPISGVGYKKSVVLCGISYTF